MPAKADKAIREKFMIQWTGQVYAVKTPGMSPDNRAIGRTASIPKMGPGAKSCCATEIAASSIVIRPRLRLRRRDACRVELFQIH